MRKKVNKQTDIATISFQDNQLLIAGDINFSSAPDLWKQSLPLLEEAQELNFNFSKVHSANSVAVALILEWIQYAKSCKKNILLSHFSDQLLTMVSISGLEKIFAPFIA